ncbi:set-like [Nannochloropsis oceanica]
MDGEDSSVQVPAETCRNFSNAADEAEEDGIKAIYAVQTELAALETAQAEGILQIIKKYSEQKLPVYARRQKEIEQVPEFWFRVLLVHPSTGEHITDLDQGALRHLTKLEVVDVKKDANEEAAVGAGGTVTMPDYRVDFHFSPNVYFTNAVLWKEYRFRDHEATVTSSEIDWKDTVGAKDLKATLVTTLMAQDPMPKDVEPSFFSIFHAEDRDLEMGEVLKNEVWRDPVGIYMSAEFEEEEEEEEGGEEEKG